MGAEPADLLQVIQELSREIAALKTEVGERREQYDALIQQNPNPTWVYSLDSLRFLDVNEAAIAAYGWSRDEFLDMTIADIRPREDVPALVANVARMRATAVGKTGPWRHQHKDGALVEVGVSFHSLRFSGRQARLIVASVSAPRPTRWFQLSPREREVFRLVAGGHTSQQIAALLAVSPKSVETYRARFMQKLALETRADIVRYALDCGILVPRS